MPIATTVWNLTAGMVASDQEQAGVYELLNAQNEVIYVGSSDNLKRRMGEHVNEWQNDCIKRNAVKYRLDYTSNYKAREKQLYDEHVRVHGKAPSCNRVAPTGF